MEPPLLYMNGTTIPGIYASQHMERHLFCLKLISAPWLKTRLKTWHNVAKKIFPKTIADGNFIWQNWGAAEQSRYFLVVSMSPLRLILNMFKLPAQDESSSALRGQGWSGTGRSSSWWCNLRVLLRTSFVRSSFYGGQNRSRCNWWCIGSWVNDVLRSGWSQRWREYGWDIYH